MKQKNDQAKDRPKETDEILDEQIESGLREHRRSNLGLLLSSFSAGLEVGFSLFLMGIVYTLYHDSISNQQLHFWLSLCYPLGFILVVIGKSELFTEHTTLAVLPVLRGSATVSNLMVVWALVYVGNLVGGYLFAVLIVYLGPEMGAISTEAFQHFALKMVKYPWHIILCSGIIAGWLMGLLSWLVTSSQETISRIFIVTLITAVIGLGGLHHSIVGSIEVFAGILVRANIDGLQYFKFQFWTTVGNALGGVVFVAIIKYSHIRPDSIMRKD
jgi:formate/nitrite transporter FocA (FNT family)